MSFQRNDPRLLAARLDDDDDDDDDDESEGKKRAAEPAAMLAQRLFETRTILIFGGIDQKLAERVTAQLLALSAAGPDPITLVINSQGGHVESGDTIHDMIRYVGPAVRILGTGWVASAGAHIFLGALKENRFCLPNTRFLLHQPMGGVRGPATDIDIEAMEIVKMRKRINETIARETGQALERVEKDTDRNFWMSAEEARDYGVVTHIIERADQLA